MPSAFQSRHRPHIINAPSSAGHVPVILLTHSDVASIVGPSLPWIELHSARFHVAFTVSRSVEVFVDGFVGNERAAAYPTYSYLTLVVTEQISDACLLARETDGDAGCGRCGGDRTEHCELGCVCGWAG